MSCKVQKLTFFIHLIYTFAPSLSQIYFVISHYLLQFLFCKRLVINCILFSIKIWKVIISFLGDWLGLKMLIPFRSHSVVFPRVTAAFPMFFFCIMIGSFYNCVCSDWLTLLSHLFSRALHLLPIFLSGFWLASFYCLSPAAVIGQFCSTALKILFDLKGNVFLVSPHRTWVGFRLLSGITLRRANWCQWSYF